MAAMMLTTAATSRTDIKQAMTAKTDNEKAVAIASKLGDMNEWSKHPVVSMKGVAYNTTALNTVCHPRLQRR